MSKLFTAYHVLGYFSSFADNVLSASLGTLKQTYKFRPFSKLLFISFI